MAKPNSINVECSYCGTEKKLDKGLLPVVHCGVFTCDNCGEAFDVPLANAYSVLAQFVLDSL
jgi:transcription elongation factor Elf1